MGILLFIIVIAGIIISSIGSIMFLIAAFRESVWWGLGVLFFGPVGIAFAITHWDECKNAILIEIFGVVICVGAAFAMSSVTTPGMPGGFPMPEQGPPTASAPPPSASPSIFERIEQSSSSKPEKKEIVRPDSEPDSYVGMDLAEVEKILGKPQGSARKGDDVYYYYPHIHLVSRDGKTVTFEKKP